MLARRPVRGASCADTPLLALPSSSSLGEDEGMLTKFAVRGASCADTPLLTLPSSSSLREDEVDEGGDVAYVYHAVAVDVAARCWI